MIGVCKIGRCSIHDFDCDGVVGFADLARLLSVWGPCDFCIEDVNGDGEAAFGDLADLLANWSS